MLSESSNQFTPPQQRIIFTVTTGRSGTNYLAELLSCLPGCQVGHEPAPYFHEWMRPVQKEATLATTFLVEQKLPTIAHTGKPVYIETSHLFCKGFFEPLMKLGVVPDLIVLRRSHRAVAASLYELMAIPGRTNLGISFYLSPSDPVTLPLPGWEHLHDYQLCYWYCLEIERRQQYYTEQVRAAGGRVVTVNLEDLSTMTEVHRLVRELNLPPPGILSALLLRWKLGRRTNTKSHKKKQLLEHAEMDRLELQLQEELGNKQ